MAEKLDNSITKPIVEEDVIKGVESSYLDDVIDPIESEEVVDEESTTAEDEEAKELADTVDDVSDVDETHTEKKSTKPLSKEESKIVALKRQNQKLLEDFRTLHSKLEEAESTKKQSTLKNQYIDQGLDEEHAERQAQKDILLEKQIARLELLEFKDDNEDVLRKYPDSKKDIARIMANVKATGMTVEQVCRGLYGIEEPVREVRAKKAATGEIGEEESGSTITSAQRASVTKQTAVLSKRDLELKRDFESRWRDGEKMTNEEFAEIKKKYRL